jgi:tetratricopeptide (TPR) repeat protein
MNYWIKLILPITLGAMLLIGNWSSQSLTLNLIATALILISVYQYFMDKKDAAHSQYELEEIRNKLDRELNTNKQFREVIANREIPIRHIEDLKKFLNDFNSSLTITQKASIHIELTWEYQKLKNWVDAISENNKALILINSLQDSDVKQGLLASVEYAFGKIYSNRSNHSKSLTHFQNARKIAVKANFIHMLPFILRDLGQELRQIGDVNQALIESEKSSEGFRKNNDLANLAVSLHFQALVYLEMGDDKNAIKYAVQSNKISIKGQLDDITADNYLLLSNRHMAIAGKKKLDNNEFMANITDAKNALNEAIKIYKRKNEKERIAYCIAQLGGIAMLENNLNLALDYFNKAKREFEYQKDNRGVANELANIGAVNFRQKKYEEALRNYRSSLDLHERMEYLDGIAHVNRLLGETYNEMSDTSNAIISLKKSYEAYEQLNNPIATTLKEVIIKLEEGIIVKFL